MLTCAYCGKPLLDIQPVPVPWDKPDPPDYMIMHGKCWEKRAHMIDVRARAFEGLIQREIKKGAEIK